MNVKDKISKRFLTGALSAKGKGILFVGLFLFFLKAATSIQKHIPLKFLPFDYHHINIICVLVVPGSLRIDMDSIKVEVKTEQQQKSIWPPPHYV